MSSKKNAPGATGALGDQLDGGSPTTVPRGSVIAYCRAERTDAPTGPYWLLVIDRCPLCGRPHRHGGGSDEHPSYGHRAAHCGGQTPRCYWLRPVEERE
ncbi:hypothetical protein [Streptomyces sp. NPDC057794]|uniref:hypothetical protein n=1 Tax=Streptomyces sp. NPDC057794 TaxID=3346251 RepID=UPI0036C1071E